MSEICPSSLFNSLKSIQEIDERPKVLKKFPAFFENPNLISGKWCEFQLILFFVKKTEPGSEFIDLRLP